jgi:uncharacterized protein (UPF0332 family)
MIDDDHRALIRYRMELAEDTLRDARRLREVGASGNSIVNRSYYTMFYAVLALANLRGFTPRKHSGAIAFFDREFVRTRVFPRELSASLHAVFDQRLESDYADFVKPSQADAEETLKLAEEFLAAISNYLQDELAPDRQS